MDLFSPLVQSFALLLIYTSSVARLESPRAGDASTPVIICPDPAVTFAGQDVEFNCTYTFEEAGLVLTWLRDSQPLMGVSTENFVMGGRLLLQDIPLEWDGSQITCSVMAGDSNGSASTNLTVYSPAPTIVAPPTSLTVEEGFPFFLACEARGLPEPTVTWTKDDMPFLPQRFQGRVEMLEGGLQFTEASDDFSGDYVCTATSEGVGMAVSPPANVKVLFAPQFGAVPQPKGSENGSMVVLECRARGCPVPTITWTHNTVLIAEGNSRVQISPEGDLQIMNLMLSDAGMYRCTARNDLGHSISDSAMLSVHVFPSIVVFPEPTTADLGDEARLLCFAVAIPAPTYSWTRNGSLIVPDPRISINNGTLLFSSLLREDAGVYVCMAENGLGPSVMSNPAILTVYAPPLPPESLRVLSSGATWLQVQWGPSPEANPAVQLYFLDYRLSFQEVWTKGVMTDQMRANLTELYPDAPYQFRVTAMSPIGLGEPSNIFPAGQPARTEQGVPLQGSTADGITALPAGPDGLNIQWMVDTVVSQTSYNGTIVNLTYPSGTQQIVTVSDFSFMVGGLEPATSYSVQLILQFTGGFQGPPTQASGTTGDDIPDDSPTITNIINITSDSLTLVWLPPTQPNGQIQFYSVYYRPLTLNISEFTTVMVPMVELRGLRPFTNYSITVSASTSAGEGPTDATVAMTAEGTPDVAPGNLMVFPLSSIALRLSWQPLSDRDIPGVLENYIIMYNQKHHGGHAENRTIDPSRTTYNLDGLRPFTVYCVRIAAVTGAGGGVFSSRQEATTYTDLPEAVVEITSLIPQNPTSLLVQWMEPDQQLVHSNLTTVNYVIKYTERGDGTEERELSLTPEQWVGLNYTLGELQPATTYIVSMAVMNDNGTGPFGDPVENTTRDGVPVAAPTGVTVEALNSTTLRVSWQPLTPENVPGTLLNYVIVYRAAGGTELQQEEVDPTRTTYDLGGLVPFTNYRVMVAGVTSGGVGPVSSSLGVMTSASIPEATVNVTSVVPKCPPVSLIVNWSNPNRALYRGPEDTVSFVVIYNKDGDVEEMAEAKLEDRSLTLEGLTFNTEYYVRVAVKNEVGISRMRGSGQRIRTGEGVPSVPRSVTIPSSTPHTLTVTWQPPTIRGGNPTYEVEYSEPEQTESLSRMAQPGELSLTLEGLKPFTEYSIKVRATTTCTSSSFSQPMVTTTGEIPPGPPVGVTVISIMEERVVIGWAEPQLPNGNILRYQVSCPGARPHTTMQFHAECAGLDPETEYPITVVAVNSAGRGEEAMVEVTTACTGTSPALTGVMVTVREEEMNCSVRARYVLVLVQELETRGGSTVPPTRSLATYSLSELKELTVVYSSSQGQRSRRQDNEGVYIAANVTSQVLADGFDLGDGMQYGDYTNHPLSPGEHYNVGLRGSDTPIFTAVGESVTGPTTPPPPTEADSFPLIPVVASAGAAGVLIVGILAIIAIIATCCCCNRSKGNVEFAMERGGSIRLSRSRKSLHPVENFRATHKTFALESHPPVPVLGFVNKLLVMRTNDNQLFLEEFGSIEMAQAFPCDAATLPANRSKNRYNNILPYDHSRVKLSSVRGQQGSTYINGNFCAGYTKQKAYIATQGPLKDTISDFWRMVWDEASKTIVMLTNPVEKTKVKCEVYWPRDVGSSELYGNIEVTLEKVIDLADYTIRTFSIQKVGSGKDAREVRQFHFTSWPDHGVPQYATAMLSMTRRVRSYNINHKDFGPMVVHCSAGVGRSGTFIIIHSTLERLDAGEDLVDIYGHVSLLRSQRNYMVQTEDQYFFIYEAVAEWIVCGNTEIPLEQLAEYVNDLYQIIPEDDNQDTTYIELQFKRLAIDKNDPHRFASANRDANKSKNRYVNVLPYETNRVCLEYIRGMEGSDYINASHIDSYHYQKAFIATQGPLKSTMVDFWRMVWKYNSPVVIMLTELVEKGTERSVQYWPAEVLQAETYGSFSIEMTVERTSAHYTYRDLHITDPESGQKRLVRHFHFHAWPEVGVPASTMTLVDFLREVQKLYATLSTRTPIIVHCSNGVGRSGVFIALHVLLERMQTEGLVDVFQAVKSLRIQRPAMVQTLEQYQFTYDAAVDYLEASPELLPLKSRLHSQGSNASELRRSRRSRTTSPQRSESFNTKGSSRNLEMNGNGSSQVYGGSEATSTFGTAQQSSPRGSLLGSQQLYWTPAGPEQTLSVPVLSYPLEP